MRTLIYFGPIKIIYRELKDQKIIGEVNEVKKESKIDLKNTIKTVSEIIFVELAFLAMPIIMWILYRYNFRSEMILELNPWSFVPYLYFYWFDPLATLYN